MFDRGAPTMKVLIYLYLSRQPYEHTDHVFSCAAVHISMHAIMQRGEVPFHLGQTLYIFCRCSVKIPGKQRCHQSAQQLSTCLTSMAFKSNSYNAMCPSHVQTNTAQEKINCHPPTSSESIKATRQVAAFLASARKCLPSLSGNGGFVQRMANGLLQIVLTLF